MLPRTRMPRPCPRPRGSLFIPHSSQTVEATYKRLAHLEKISPRPCKVAASSKAASRRPRSSPTLDPSTHPRRSSTQPLPPFRGVAGAGSGIIQRQRSSRLSRWRTRIPHFPFLPSFRSFCRRPSVQAHVPIIGIGIWEHVHDCPSPLCFREIHI